MVMRGPGWELIEIYKNLYKKYMHTRTPQMIEHEHGQLEHDKLGRQSQSIRTNTNEQTRSRACVGMHTVCAPAD